MWVLRVEVGKVVDFPINFFFYNEVKLKEGVAFYRLEVFHFTYYKKTPLDEMGGLIINIHYLR